MHTGKQKQMNASYQASLVNRHIRRFTGYGYAWRTCAGRPCCRIAPPPTDFINWHRWGLGPSQRDIKWRPCSCSCLATGNIRYSGRQPPPGSLVTTSGLPEPAGEYGRGCLLPGPGGGGGGSDGRTAGPDSGTRGRCKVYYFPLEGRLTAAGGVSDADTSPAGQGWSLLNRRPPHGSVGRSPEPTSALRCWDVAYSEALCLGVCMWLINYVDQLFLRRCRAEH